MNALSLAQFYTLLAASVPVAFAMLWLLARTNDNERLGAPDLLTTPENAVVMLFDDHDLVDATPPGRTLIATSSGGVTEWQQLLAALRPRFPDLDNQLADLATEGKKILHPASPNDTGQLRAEWWDGYARIELLEAKPDDQPDLSRFETMENELSILRQVVLNSPHMAWKQNPDGDITWANRTYLDQALRFSPTRDSGPEIWPPARLFPGISMNQGAPEGRAHRVSVRFPDAQKDHWYECYSKTLGAESLHFAMDADAVVRAEGALRDFVQTLTKTFAHLPTGLAIFDRNRQLALFNPALTDLTTMPVDFLTSRPTLFSFLDRLRERQMMPEPKNYKSWRLQLTELEAAATDGTYSETWALPSGQTYRVTGRPHPDGAVAFLFDDISSEISLTRRFRAELETGQAVLDSLTDAIAVFSSSGMLVLSNDAYADLWRVDPSSTFGEMGIAEAICHWKNRCQPTAVWGDLREFIKEPGERREWAATIRMKDENDLHCRFSPLAGAATLARFVRSAPVDPMAELPVFRHRHTEDV